jgi:hypothetical protein
MHSEHECPQHVVRHPGAGVPQDLGVTLGQPEQAQRVDPRVHARDDGQPARRLPAQMRVFEPGREGHVGAQYVGECISHVVNPTTPLVARRRTPGYGHVG